MKGEGQEQVVKSREGLDNTLSVAPCCLSKRDNTGITGVLIWAQTLGAGQTKDNVPSLKTMSKAIGRSTLSLGSTREMQTSTFPSLEVYSPESGVLHAWKPRMHAWETSSGCQLSWHHVRPGPRAAAWGILHFL